MNSKGNTNAGKGFNMKENTERFSQAMEVMVKTCKNIIGYFDRVGVSTALVSFLKKTGSYQVKKEERTQKLKDYPDGEEGVKDTEGHAGVWKTGLYCATWYQKILVYLLKFRGIQFNFIISDVS